MFIMLLLLFFLLLLLLFLFLSVVLLLQLGTAVRMHRPLAVNVVIDLIILFLFKLMVHCPYEITSFVLLLLLFFVVAVVVTNSHCLLVPIRE